jgi:folate-binding protein YgfZ
MNGSWGQALIERGARIEDGRLTGFGDSRGEGSRPTKGTAITALLSQGLILASGADAPPFLQGQLSNDITQISRSRAQLAAHCTPKGRVLATLLLWKTDDGYALELPRELCESIRKRLQMYVLRSRVQLADASEQAALIGLVGADAPALARSELGLELASDYDVAQNEGVAAIALPNGRVQVVADIARGAEIWDRLAPRCRVMAEEIWDAQTVAAGIPAITTATQDQFTPHMLNLDLVGGVSFDKGCYTGQEIVARTQYLGQVKRRLARFATTARATAGAAVYADAAQVGTVVNAAPSPAGEFELLAVTQTRATPAGVKSTALHLGVDGPALRPLVLPYAVPGTRSSSTGDDDD